MKLLVWLMLGFLVYLAVRKNMRSSNQSKPRPTWTEEQQESTHYRKAPGPDHASETMVSCAQCQVFIPSSEAVRRGTQIFCCEEHAQQFTAS